VQVLDEQKQHQHGVVFLKLNLFKVSCQVMTCYTQESDCRIYRRRGFGKLSLQEIQNKIFEAIPTLDKILRVIADSVAGSETSYTTSCEEDTVKDFL